MATLSEEQKRRIEENKKKALAIRAAKLSNDSISNKPANHSSNTSISKKILYCDPLPVVTKNLNSCKTDCVPNKFNKQKLPNKLNFYSNVPSGNQNQSQTKVITVNFSLISKNRFTVDFLFNKDIVELLKTVPGKLYGMFFNFKIISSNIKIVIYTVKLLFTLSLPKVNFFLSNLLNMGNIF